MDGKKEGDRKDIQKRGWRGLGNVRPNHCWQGKGVKGGDEGVKERERAKRRSEGYRVRR